MKKLFVKFMCFLLALFALTAPPAAQAADEYLTVADGSGQSRIAPIYGNYCDTQGSYSVMLYPSSILTDMNGKEITGLKFYPKAATSFSGTFKVSLCETEATTASSSIVSNPTVVKTGLVLATGLTSVEIPFDDSYSYNGKNLVVKIEVTTRGTDANTYFAGETQSSAMVYTSQYTQDSKNFIPKTTFTYLGEDVPYAASVTPQNIAFGKFTVGASANTQNVTLKNKGTNPFTPSVSVSGTNFSTNYTAAELAAGATVQIPVTFNPATAGNFTGTLTISCGNGIDDFEIPLTASAVQEVTAAEGTATDTHLPVYGLYYDEGTQTNQMIYPASMLKGLNGKKITSMTFYTSATSFISGGKVTFSLVNLPAETASFSSAARLTPSDLTQVYSSAPSVAQEWTITFSDDVNFVYNGGNLLIDVQTESGTYKSMSFSGESGHTNASWWSYRNNTGNTLTDFLPQVTFTYEDSETPATPVITVDPATVDPFSTEVGTPVTATVNVTGENLTDAITATVSGDNADYFTATLENGVLTITYNPNEAGNHSATLTLSSTGAQDVTIALTGTATAPAVDYDVTISDNTGAHNYGNVLVNSTNVWTLTITNNGTQSVTPTLSGIEAPFSTDYTATALATGESATIAITFAPTELGESTNAITISFPEANGTIEAYTCELTGTAVEQSPEPTDDNEVVKLVTVDKRSIYEPNFIDTANGNNTPQQLNCYDMRFMVAQPDDPAKKIKAGDLRPGNNLYEFYAIDDFGTEFRFATINLFAEGNPSTSTSTALDAPIKVTPSVEYYTEDGMPVHPTFSHNTELKYTEKIYNDVNELVDFDVIDYVNDTWSANTATNSHPDHYKFQIRGVGQFGDLVTSLTAEYVESHMTGYGNSLVLPEGWERGSWVGPNNEIDNVHTYYYYDLYIKKSFFDERGITGPVTVVVNTTLSGSGFNADNYKAMSVNGVEQIIAKEEFKDYSWTVPLGNDLPTNTVVEQVPMGVVIRLVSTGADFNRTTGIYIYGGGTGVSNVDTVSIYKSSMNVKAYTQKQVDEDTDRNLVGMNSGATADVNVLVYDDPAVTGYTLYENSSASTTGMTQVSTASRNANGDYAVESTDPEYNDTYEYVRDESLGSIDGMWLPMYEADPTKYFLPVTYANGVGDDGVVRSRDNTYGSAMQQVQENGSISFNKSECVKSEYTWTQDGVTYAIYNPDVKISSSLPGDDYQLYNYRLWVDYEDDAPAWDFEKTAAGKINLTEKMDRPLYEGTNDSIGGESENKESWTFVAPADLTSVKLVARCYYKKISTASNAPVLKARPTDSDRLYYVVESQETVPTSKIVTGIYNVTAKNVVGVKYYNVQGVESKTPFNGVNIEVTTYDDGTRTTRKVLR